MKERLTMKNINRGYRSKNVGKRRDTTKRINQILDKHLESDRSLFDFPKKNRLNHHQIKKTH